MRPPEPPSSSTRARSRSNSGNNNVLDKLLIKKEPLYLDDLEMEGEKVNHLKLVIVSLLFSWNFSRWRWEGRLQRRPWWRRWPGECGRFCWKSDSCENKKSRLLDWDLGSYDLGIWNEIRSQNWHHESKFKVLIYNFNSHYRPKLKSRSMQRA